MNVRLLESALTHRSFVHERPERSIGLENSERLEFLGDAILNYLTATLLFPRFPEQGEGDLTGLRSALVKTTTLAGFAREFDLGAYMRLSKGEEMNGARERTALLADTFEALIAAIYIDQGIDVVSQFVTPLFERQLTDIATNGLTLDYKSQLQQRIQAERNITPHYSVIAEEGRDPQREYTIEVLAGEERLGVGSGRSKQIATQAAAHAALEYLGEATPQPRDEQITQRPTDMPN